MSSMYDFPKKESILCNFCGGDSLKLIAKKDSTESYIDTCICRKCGLIFINPRPIKEWYKRYYEEGEYRIQNGKVDLKLDEAKLERSFSKRAIAGEALADSLGKYFRKGLTIDVGSGVGGLLYGLKNKLGLDVLGIEPSYVESGYANSRGIKTLSLIAEDILDGSVPMAKNIICTQALNHFLDPKKFLIWAYNSLEKNGVLYLEVKDFLFQARQAGRLKNAVQIDHTYMFLSEVLFNFVKSSGFDIIFSENDRSKSLRELKRQKQTSRATHIRLIAVKSNRSPFSEIFIKPFNFRISVLKLNDFFLCWYPYFYDFFNRYF